MTGKLTKDKKFHNRVIDYGDALFLAKPFSSGEGMFMCLFGSGILMICWQMFDDIGFIVSCVINLLIASIVAFWYIKKCKNRGIYFRNDSVELVFLPAWKYDHGYHLIFKKDITEIQHDKYGTFICIEFEHEFKQLSMKYRMDSGMRDLYFMLDAWFKNPSIADLRRELLLQQVMIEPMPTLP